MGNGRRPAAGEQRLQAQLGTGTRAGSFYREQVLDHLNAEMQAFVARQELLFLGTADGNGECDCSLRAGPPGFVTVLDPHRLAYPEYRGNGVMASLGNIEETGRAGLLFLDFTRDVIGLHVNGRARVVADDDLRGEQPLLPHDDHPGRKAALWLVVEVEEAYVHCSKHIPQLLRLPPQRRYWGSDDRRRKGGDFFRVSSSTRTDAPRAVRHRPVADG
ncbi:MAG: pyridoxamine 5'-phosphate oxidase family protein [Actinomycetota bacterium]|nr:pyridoxamine 5'-phosphate oxidase family protein [Actinomycetota bacterium]